MEVDLGAARKAPARTSESKPAPAPARQRRHVRNYDPAEVWRGSPRLLGRRIRVKGLGKVFTTLDDQLLVRFQQDSRSLVNCFVDAGRFGPLEGKVKHGECRPVTLEGEVHSSTGGAVVMGNGRVIEIGDPLDP
jgi:hypothetical protein